MALELARVSVPVRGDLSAILSDAAADLAGRGMWVIAVTTLKQHPGGGPSEVLVVSSHSKLGAAAQVTR